MGSDLIKPSMYPHLIAMHEKLKKKKIAPPLYLRSTKALPHSPPSPPQILPPDFQPREGYRPTCQIPGCTNLAQPFGRRKDGSPVFRKQCQRHHRHPTATPITSTRRLQVSSPKTIWPTVTPPMRRVQPPPPRAASGHYAFPMRDAHGTRVTITLHPQTLDAILLMGPHATPAQVRGKFPDIPSEPAARAILDRLWELDPAPPAKTLKIPKKKPTRA